MLAAFEHMFPATIHPMVVHFTIAITYLATLAGLIGLLRRKSDFWPRSFLYLLGLGILATIAAGVAGVISESYIRQISPTVAPMFHRHKEYGVLTGVALIFAFVAQWLLGLRKQRVAMIGFIASLVATVLVSLAGHLGGTLVYHDAFGVG
ncbi:hypothetical protein URH17368_0251 [Alicyclobacillus hesperidum URH17-3-68]|uniref:DUF2231 domain-containing protein n=1 Tax=Alicyclobacillus hesperidum TaxID=89784 RepID=A0AA37TXS0_9BACL|nr:DUF2231 domain-containing protein [Alicyclobacillus hesperidum]EJY57066.1 hypothetical protein URH17368_0251 [Alicyclobacillus hesperidum URH17-3-68]GLV14116.1 hypothetical protein Heshes_18000 [Alicyclobacillus hesperidum]